MNERIQKLAEQAEEHSYKEYAKRETGYTREDFFTKKFAELIVKECAEVSVLGNPNYSAQYNILNHFGIK